LVLRMCDNPKLTFGMASYYAGAGGVNFPGDPNNPILAPKFPAIGAGGIVLGPIYSNFALLQTASYLSFQVTDRLSIGGGPVVDTVLASLDPAFFAAPSPSGAGLLTFPSATDGRMYWGGGFKVGAYYHLLPSVDVGFGYTSPQWMENAVWNARDPAGNAVTVTLPLQMPAIYSAGISVKPTERLLVAADCRLFDNLNSTPFGLAPAAGGLGWQDVFSAAVGAQYQFGPRFSGRLGYSYNTLTFPGSFSLFNVQFPVVTRHVVSAGITARIADNVYTSLAYAYFVRNSVSGSAFQIPGGNVNLTSDIHSIFLTMTVKFGTPSRDGETASPSTGDGYMTSGNSYPYTTPQSAITAPIGAPIQ